MSDFEHERKLMVEQQISGRGIRDPRVLTSMGIVPRHRFVSSELQSRAYDDHPLPIGEGQTISQPYIVALMMAAAKLTPESRVLDVGTGSGYAAAVASRIVHDVYTVERIPILTQRAQQLFQELNYTNIFSKTDDGSLGWQENAPYDAIMVAAGAPEVSDALRQQLKVGGRLIIPVGDSFSQQLLRITRRDEKTFTQEILDLVRFVPLIGEQGWRS